MVKIVYVLARRADVPAARFYDYWLNSHGPRVRGHANAIHARKYIQSHLIDTPLNRGFQEPRGMLDPVAGITEVWWDSPADFERGGDDPARSAATRDLAEDEAKFIDIARSQVFLTEEHTIFDYTGGAKLGPDAIKVTYLLSKRDSLSVAECHKTWLNDHGPLVTSFANDMRAAKYIQSHTIAPEFNAAVVKSRGFATPLDGITEVWWKSMDDLTAGSATPRGAEAYSALIEDERRFVELSRSRCFLTREHVIFDYTSQA
ncbi:MAG TPA: EthD domain-containing protein [Candidatus Binataceae bacterium]